MPFHQKAVLLALFAFVVVISFSQVCMANEGECEATVTEKMQEDATADAITKDTAIELGTTDKGIAYFHCSSNKPSLVLLHGAAFKKETWKEIGVMQDFCEDWSVVALDLGVQATSSDLVSVLHELEAQKRITLPIQGLVSPSASGRSVLSGLGKDLPVLMQKIKSWIPVACNGVIRFAPSNLKQLADAKWPIYSIYGNKDKPGEKSSKLLVSHAGASMLELQGRHPVYLDSPKEFVSKINEFLSSLPVDTESS